MLDAYGREVWSRIAAHKPQGLRLAASTGLSFTIAADGALVGASVARSSGSADLDRLALLTLQSASPFRPPPAALRAAPLTFAITFEFR